MAEFICSPKFHGAENHMYQPKCMVGNFQDGYYSQIRGTGSGIFENSHVFPGTAQLGNESGVNMGIFNSNPDIGPLIKIRHRYNGNPGYHTVYIRS
jgi:hypothetical protein